MSAASRTHMRVVLLAARSTRASTQYALPIAAAPAVVHPKSSATPPTSFVWLLAPPLSEHISLPRPIRICQSAPFKARPRAFYSAWLSAVSLKARKALAEGESWLESPDIKAGSIREWMARGFAAVKSRIDPREIMLAQVSKFCAAAEDQQSKATDAAVSTQPAASADPPALIPPTPFVWTVQHPAEVDLAHLRVSLLSFLSSRQSFHTRRLYLLSALLPFTLIATVLPGPNVFLALCAFRIFGHQQARAGATKLKAIIQQQAKDGAAVDASPTNHEHSNDDEAVPVHLQLIPYSLPGLAPSLMELCTQLRLDPVEVGAMLRRWE